MLIKPIGVLNKIVKSSFVQYGIYTEAQFDDYVNNQNYIPIASATELDNSRTTTTQTMGAGTKYEGDYPTGTNGKNYIIYQPLDLTAFLNWNPIGYSSINIRGNRVLINNLTINRPTTNNQAIWGVGSNSNFYDILAEGSVTGQTSVAGVIANLTTGIIDNCTFRNGTVTGTNYVAGVCGFINSTGTTAAQNTSINCTITGTNYVGGLFGRQASPVTNSFSTSNIIGNGSGGNIGGLCGEGTQNITDSYATGSVTDNTSNCKGIGGLVGTALNSGTYTYTRCYATGAVNSPNANSNTGGLVGETYANLVDCYATGATTGVVFTGGLAGIIRNNATNCYSTGLTSSTDVNVGGLAAFLGGTATDCFWDTQTSGQATSAAGTGKTTAQMKQQATFTNWNFTTIWDIVENTTYPFLR